MPRPKKWRKVCRMPRATEFVPIGTEYCSEDAVVMTVDEYEAIRLIEHEGFTQEEFAGYMKIARTTVQQIHNSARKKLSVLLVEGKPLLINGGEYRLCDGNEPYCGCGGCHRHRRGQMSTEKGDTFMKIAIPVDEKILETSVCASLGRAPYFLLRDTESGKDEFIVNTAADAQGGAGLKAAQLIVDSGADVVLTVRCGRNAADVLKAAGVKIYKTELTGVKENLAAFQEGKLAEMTQFHAGFHGRR